IEDARGGRIFRDQIVAIATVEGPMRAVEPQTVHGMETAVVVLRDHARRGMRISLIRGPGRFGGPAARAAVSTSVNKEILVYVKYGSFLVEQALVRLDHATHSHLAEEAVPDKEGFGLRCFGRFLDALDAHDILGPLARVGGPWPGAIA